MAAEQSSYEQERDLLMRCIEDAHEALHVMVGVDENGPILVWLADHLYQTQSRVAQPA